MPAKVQPSASSGDGKDVVAALAGKAQHAEHHVRNGVDIVVAQGTEAGGHTGEIATMVLVPEVVDAHLQFAPVSQVVGRLDRGVTAARGD